MLISTADTAIIITALTAEILKELGIPSPGVTQGALMYAGWQLATGQYFTSAAVIGVILLGGLAGALAAYALARYPGLRFVERFSRFIKLTPEKLDQVKSKLKNKTLPVILFFRLVIPLKVTLSAAAGLLSVRLGTFTAGITIALVIWEAFYAVIGAAGRQVFETIRLPWNIGLIPAILIAVALGFLIRFGGMWGIRKWEEVKIQRQNTKSQN